MTVINAVLTGDLVSSTSADPQAIDRAMDVLAMTALDIARWPISENTDVGDTHFTRFRGDGWQIFVSASCFGLRAALLMYARLAGTAGLPPTRIGVGLAANNHIQSPSLSDAYGEAFACSGHILEKMANGQRVRLAGAGITPMVAAFISLLDDRIAGWTPEQAEAVAHVIAPSAPKQAAVAMQLGISPQALSYRLTGAKWPTIRQVLTEWEHPTNHERDAK